MWCRWQISWPKVHLAKPSNYQVTTATASEYIWTFRALTRRLSHAMGLQYLLPPIRTPKIGVPISPKHSIHFCSALLLQLQEFRALDQTHQFCCQRAMRSVTHIPGCGYKAHTSIFVYEHAGFDTKTDYGDPETLSTSSVWLQQHVRC